MFKNIFLTVNDVNFPGSALHPLKGDLLDYWAVTVKANWRIIFKFDTTPELWLNMQRNYDLWNAGQRVKLSRIKAFRKSKNITSQPAPSHAN